MNQIIKYPRTHHISGSGLQAGDKEIPFSQIEGKHVVVEEKMDGANSGISFLNDNLMLQSRGHYLTGGPREKHFDLFKAWAYTHVDSLRKVLEDRYIMFGEWLYAKHTIYYNRLPSYFMEFDIYDKEREVFLDTVTRLDMTMDLRFISPVKVLYIGHLTSIGQLTKLIGPSYFIKDEHIVQLKDKAEEKSLDSNEIIHQTDPSNIMEGLYIKVEEDGIVKERYKYVREGFLQVVIDSDSHWLDRPIIPNDLRSGVKFI